MVTKEYDVVTAPTATKDETCCKTRHAAECTSRAHVVRKRALWSGPDCSLLPWPRNVMLVRQRLELWV